MLHLGLLNHSTMRLNPANTFFFPFLKLSRASNFVPKIKASLCHTVCHQRQGEDLCSGSVKRELCTVAHANK